MRLALGGLVGKFSGFSGKGWIFMPFFSFLILSMSGRQSFGAGKGKQTIAQLRHLLLGQQTFHRQFEHLGFFNVFLTEVAG